MIPEGLNPSICCGLSSGVNTAADARISINATHKHSSDAATLREAPGRPPRALGAQLADQILDAAQHLFLDQGFETTTVEEIAEHVGPPSIIYVRFADKAQLFRAVVTRVLDARRPRLGAIGTERTVDERLTDMGLALLRYVLDPDVVRVCRVVTAEAYRFPELNRMIEEQAARGVAPAVERILEEEVQLGRIELQNIPFATTLLLSLLTGMPARERGRGSRPEPCRPPALGERRRLSVPRRRSVAAHQLLLSQTAAASEE